MQPCALPTTQVCFALPVSRSCDMARTLHLASVRAETPPARVINLLIASNGAILGVVLRAQVWAPVTGFSPAASGSALIVVIVLPVVSYLVSIRCVYLYGGAVRIGYYIDEILQPNIPGGIGWETWLATPSCGSLISRNAG